MDPAAWARHGWAGVATLMPLRNYPSRDAAPTSPAQDDVCRPRARCTDLRSYQYESSRRREGQDPCSLLAWHPAPEAKT